MARASADIVPIGVLSFDVLNPAAGTSPGINDFEIDNFTEAFALPDFPILNPLTFQGSQISFSDSDGSPAVTLGDLGPGSYTPDSLQFLDSDLFSSAELQATLSQTTFALSDGTTFVADSSTIDTLLLPSSGPDLVAGVDFAIISVSGEVAAVPEPRGDILLLTILFFCFGAFRMKRRRAISEH